MIYVCSHNQVKSTIISTSMFQLPFLKKGNNFYVGCKTNRCTDFIAAFKVNWNIYISIHISSINDIKCGNEMFSPFIGYGK